MTEGFDMNALLAQAQQMQEQMLAARDNLAAREFEAATGGDLVKVKLNGLGELLDVTIAPAACDPEDTESLSALIVAAFRSARQQVESAAASATPRSREWVSELYEGPIQDLIDELSRLPGIGPRGAQRIAFHLLDAPEEEVFQLADVLRRVKEAARFCEVCFNVSQETRCRVCRDPRRDRSLLCVVEESKDVVAIERTGEFRGTYHVLGGSISPIDGRGPGDLHTRELFQRLADGTVTEVILATDPDTEGEATASYLGRMLRDFGVRVTRPASGLPVGGDIEYADQITLGRAFEGRRSMFGDEPEPAPQPTPEEPARDETKGDDRERNTAYQSLVGTPAR